jgi:hypothetical protein
MLESVGVEFNLKYSDGHFFCDVKCDCYCDCHVALANFIIFFAFICDGGCLSYFLLDNVMHKIEC